MLLMAIMLYGAVAAFVFVALILTEPPPAMPMDIVAIVAVALGLALLWPVFLPICLRKS